jgi:biotin synthase
LRVLNRAYIPTEPELTTNGSVQTALHERAAAATREHFGRHVFVRAVVEISNFCRENCSYCGMRRDNRSLARFRAHHEQLAAMLIEHRPSTVTDINIQAGEDPVAVREVALPLIKTLQRETDLGISVCLGTLTQSLYDELKNAGASIYIIKFEIGDATEYEREEAPGTLGERLMHIRMLADAGWNVSSGFIVGLPGQKPEDLASNLRLANTLPLRGCSVSPFIPGGETPLAKLPAANINWTLNCMAAMRVMRPEWVIPAVSALNLADHDGYLRGLRAGANLVTMNLTPDELRGDYVIYKRDRFIMTEERVLKNISAANLAPSTESLADYYERTRRPASSKALAQA